MTTSGSANWNPNSGAIINAAFRKINIFDKSVAPDTYDQAAAVEALNNIIFSLYSQGMPVWAMTTTSFNLQLGVTAYPVGMLTGNQPNLIIDAPLKIVQAWSRDNISNTDIPMNIYTQYNYNLLSTKINQGYPVHLWYQPLNQAGMLTIWPAPDQYTATNRTIYFVYQRPFEQFNSTSDTPDFPQNWIEPLVYLLAHRLSPEYGVPLSEQDKLNETATKMVSDALAFGTEEGSLFLQPDWVVMGMGNNNGY